MQPQPCSWPGPTVRYLGLATLADLAGVRHPEPARGAGRWPGPGLTAPARPPTAACVASDWPAVHGPGRRARHGGHPTRGSAQPRLQAPHGGQVRAEVTTRGTCGTEAWPVSQTHSAEAQPASSRCSRSSLQCRSVAVATRPRFGTSHLLQQQ